MGVCKARKHSLYPEIPGQCPATHSQRTLVLFPIKLSTMTLIFHPFSNSKPRFWLLHSKSSFHPNSPVQLFPLLTIYVYYFLLVQTCKASEFIFFNLYIAIDLLSSLSYQNIKVLPEILGIHTCRSRCKTDRKNRKTTNLSIQVCKTNIEKSMLFYITPKPLIGPS